MPAKPERRLCPDEGTCHHECKPEERCWRVDNAAPLSDVFPNDEWPPDATGLCPGSGQSMIAVDYNLSGCPECRCAWDADLYYDIVPDHQPANPKNKDL